VLIKEVLDREEGNQVVLVYKHIYKRLSINTSGRIILHDPD